MKKLLLVLSLTACFVSAQTDRGTITGTISDPAGAVVPNAGIVVRNTETGAVYQAGASATGNYTIPMPTGNYELTVTVTGFKKYVRQNIVLPVAQSIRVDVALEVGTTSDSVTVTEAAPLLKTESGELSHNVETSRLNNLPVLTIGGTTAGLRNVYSAIQLIPGTTFNSDATIRVNGMIGNSQSMRIEGQDSSNRIFSANQSTTQPSVDAIQEVAIQTSNFAAEFGQAGGGVFNLTMKSGTNNYHGTAYEYFVNEALNAGQPFTDDGSGKLFRNRQRRHDYGFTFGGPIRIPKVYQGRDRSFFFFNFERFQEDTLVNTITTFPTAAYRAGNFATAQLTRNLCPAATLNCDPLGRPIIEGTVYDPKTDRLVNGLRVRDPFPGNVVPRADWDAVATKVQGFIPQPNLTAGLINNTRLQFLRPNRSSVPSLKLDHNLSSKAKISGFWSRTANQSPVTDGLPFPITSSVPRDYVSNTYRINYDHTLSPTLLGHLGVGLVRTRIFQPGTDYDVVGELGLRGTYTSMFPQFTGLNNAATGGMSSTMGSGNQNDLDNTKPTANASLTWVKNNHTYKFGGEFIAEGFNNFTRTYANGWITFAGTQTGLPSTNGQSLTNSNIGFNYASFLLGGVDNGRISNPSKTRLGSHALSWFVQDTWKVTRKLTLDYGLRYDFQTYLKEHHGRIPVFAAGLPNPAAGGRLGDVAFEGNGPGRCNCNVAHNYPWAFGPRLGMAYQIDSKTVLRVGAGISYNRTDNNNNLSYSIGSLQIYNSTSFGDPIYNLRSGLPFNLSWPNFSAGQFPYPGNLNAPNVAFDHNAGRPARTVQWSVGLQRQLMRDLVIEAAYVGNRGAWWSAPPLIDINALTEDRIAKFGLNLQNADDRRLLATPLNQAYAAQRGFNALPYATFPSGSTVAQTLRPFPQFGNITYRYSPLGRTWYDSLQMKATKRLSHGLDLTAAFTFQKELTMGAENEFFVFGVENPQVNDAYNRKINKYLSGFSQPFTAVIAGNYTTPRLPGNAIVRNVLGDWTIGAVMQYSSGKPIRVPAANNQLASHLFRGTFVNRVPGVDPFLQDLNCHCFDPTKELTLNPAAWQQPAQGQFGTAAAYYNDYREQRRPRESMSIGRVFRIGARDRNMTLQVRGEFQNIFNRTFMNNPVDTNAAAASTCSTAGSTATACTGNFTARTGGFGWINTATVASPARQGQLVARFTF